MSNTKCYSADNERFIYTELGELFADMGQKVISQKVRFITKPTVKFVSRKTMLQVTLFLGFLRI